MKKKSTLKIVGGLLTVAGFVVSFFSDKIKDQIEHDEMVEAVQEQVELALNKKE